MIIFFRSDTYIRIVLFLQSLCGICVFVDCNIENKNEKKGKRKGKEAAKKKKGDKKSKWKRKKKKIGKTDYVTPQ